MRIRMYNVGFGDCFCIRDRKSSLLVDFGAANSKIEGRPRREVFDVIISDLTTIRKKNLLLTHFHPDHVSGLLYMMRYRRDAYEFEKIYLPDVFSGPEMKYTLALLLLADVTKKASLPGRRVSLFALAEALCARKVKIDLLSRGSEFEGKYTALWPDVSEVSRETEEVFNFLIENHENAMTACEHCGGSKRAVSVHDRGDTGSRGEIGATVCARRYRWARELFERPERVQRGKRRIYTGKTGACK